MNVCRGGGGRVWFMNTDIQLATRGKDVGGRIS